ncbi:unnamed protein product [Prunus armeniaca]
MKELGFGPMKPMVLYCDNTAAIKIANIPIQHDTPNILRLTDISNIVNSIIIVPHIKIANQLADMMTLAVSSKDFHTSLSKLGVCHIYAPT